MFHLFLKGGIMMYPLLACSLWAVYMIIQKILLLKYNPILTPSLLEKVQNKVLASGKAQTIQELQVSNDVGVQFIANVIAASSLPLEEVQDRMGILAGPVILKMESNMNMLSALITVAPMIGLLGTVLGLIDIFRGLAMAAAGDPTVMYSGISIALVNTVTGLLVAIPCAFFFQYLSHKLEVAIADMEVQINGFLDFCQAQKR